jgi:type IV pilus assembly protein PilO
MAIVPSLKDGSGNLSLEATARTYRYLDALEIAENQKATASKNGNKKGAP